MIDSRIKIINVESGNLSSPEAISKILLEIEALKLYKQVKVLEIVHGYGSSGKGGTIKRELQLLLPSLKKQNKILDFSPNERFSPQSEKYKHFTKLYPELILDKNLQNLNPGVTLIFL